MARYRSTFATHQERPRRWPWMVLVLLLLAGAAGATYQFRDQARIHAALVAVRLSTEPAKTGVDNLTPEADAAAVVPTKDAAEPTSTVPNEDPVTGEASPDSGPSPTTRPTVTPAADPPMKIAQQYAESWIAGDYAGMYALLTDAAQKTVDEQSFVERYAAIADEAGITGVDVALGGEVDVDGSVAMTVSMTSVYLGDITQENKIRLKKEGKQWGVAWSPSLIFKGLGDYCIDYSASSSGRGAILDKDGNPLAYDGTISQIGIIPGEITNEKSMLSALAKITGLKSSEIKEKYKDADPGWFVPIRKYPEQMDQEVLNGIASLDGVAVRTTTARIYPLGPKAAHITGYVSDVTAEDLAADTTGSLMPGGVVGRAGLEYAANELLAGKPGGALAIVECGSRVDVLVIADQKGTPPKDLILTIDSAMQIATDDALGNVKGSAVVLDPDSGGVLAMASHPSYDPNGFVLGFSDEEWADINDESKRPMLNRAMQAAYPTGSIFKIITMAGAMHYLGWDGTTEIDCPAYWSIPGSDQVWQDWTVAEGVGPQGWMNLHTALVTSCNTVFYEIGNQLDEKDDANLPTMARAFGLGEATGIPYLNEVAGTVPDPQWKLDTFGDYWARGDAVNLSIGQGYFEATPLQMTVAYTAIANGGDVLQPFIVEFTKVSGEGKKRIGKRTVRNELPLKADQVAEIQSAMRDQASNTWGSGSSRVFGDLAWPIAGKTGTAQNTLTPEGTPHSWFAAFGPYGEKSTIASIVMVESVGEGVSFAAPITRLIYDAYLADEPYVPSDQPMRLTPVATANPTA